MAGTFSLAFRGTFDQLLTRINVDNGLLFHLSDYSVLTYSQVLECQSQASAEERAFKLLELLERRDDSMFEDFLRALEETDQSHVVDFLKKSNKKASWAAPPSRTVANRFPRPAVRLRNHFSVQPCQ